MKKVSVLLTFLVFLGLQLVQAQTQQITGSVTSAEDGLGVPGASVVVRGTTIGTITDVDGNYSLSAPADATYLIFSFIGLKTEEVSIDGRTAINIRMDADVHELDEVVVTSFGISREKRAITYQTQKVASEDLVTVDPSRAASALVGKVAGMQINVQDNGVNPNTQILLRGVRSISANNEALIVIDGSIATSAAFDDLNPNDIENLSVLKGATAAALYGSMAGNGVLLVTTKSGKGADKFTIGIKSSYTIDKVAYMPDFQTEYGTGWEGAYDNIENTNWGPRFDGTSRQIGPTFPDDHPLETQMVPYAPVKDNLLNFFENGDNISNTVYLTGSSDNSSFYLSFGDQRADGIVPEDTYKRNTVRANVSKKIGKVELAVNASYLKDKTDVVGDDIGDQDRPLYWFVLNQSANIPLEKYSDWDNPLSYAYADNYYNAYYQNPYWAIGTTRDNNETERLVANFSVAYDILDWLNLTTRASANNVSGTGKEWRAYQEYDEDLQPAHSTVSSYVEDTEFQRKTFTASSILTGDLEFGSSLTLKAILGGNVYSDAQRESTLRANNLSILGFYDISNGTGELVGSVDERDKRVFGFFGDFTLGYNNYLFLNFSGRNDWTSTLDSENNSYFYPSVGLSFVITDAVETLSDNNILSYAKITASNSTVYNDLAPYQISERYYKSNADDFIPYTAAFPFGELAGFYLGNTAVDSEIKKEKLNTTEIGLNLGFMEGRLWTDFAWFTTTTTDLITRTTPSFASGATRYLTNIGKLQGSGIELSLGGAVINTQNLRWDLILNYSSNETIVKEIKPGLNEVALYTTGQYGVYAVKDKAFPQLQANIYEMHDGKIVVNGVNGIPEEAEGVHPLGKTTPDYILGLTSVLSYRGFTVSATMDYRTGHVYYEEGSDAMEFTGRSMASISANRQDFIIPNSVIEVSDGVFEPNTTVAVEGGRQSYWTDEYNVIKSNYVKDATALKIREFAVNYELPKSILGNTPLKKVVVGFIARNPLTWLPGENRFGDPEFNNQISRAGNAISANAIGIGGYLQSPPTKSYGFSLNVEF